MPAFQSAKTVAENALRTIGAFPVSQSQADEGELRVALTFLEMLLNEMSGIRPLAGFFRVIEFPIEAGIGDYILPDYADAAETQHVFSVCMVDDLGNVDPLTIMWESDEVLENLTKTGGPNRCIITKDAAEPKLKIYPAPTQSDEDMGKKIRLRIQTYHPALDSKGIGNGNLLVRPSWYLCLTKKTAYECGCGPVRRLPENELKRLQDDSNKSESLLLARDGQYNAGSPPVQEPMAGWDA